MRTLFCWRLLVMVCMVALVDRPGWAQTAQEFAVDPKLSNVTVNVGRSGVFGFAGHDHEVVAPALAGTVIVDPADASHARVTIEFDATAMKVTGRDEPAEDVPEVQRVMLSDQVLDVQRYPKITFTSRRLVVLSGSPHRLNARLEGDLTLHGTSRSVSLPVDVQLSADRVTATGKTEVRQTDFGIKPVKAGGGTVKVKDEVEVVFTIVARRP